MGKLTGKSSTSPSATMSSAAKASKPAEIPAAGQAIPRRLAKRVATLNKPVEVMVNSSTGAVRVPDDVVNPISNPTDEPSSSHSGDPSGDMGDLENTEGTNQAESTDSNGDSDRSTGKSSKSSRAGGRAGGRAGSRSNARGGHKVSMRQVAETAQVSVATVSMVLNDNPRISDTTCRKVRKVMQDLGYRPNRIAQSLSGQYTRTLGVLLPPLRHAFSDPYFGELLSGICDRAIKLGHKVILEQAKPDFIRERRHVELFDRRFVDGILALGMNDRHGFLSDLNDPSYPTIMVNNYFHTMGLDHVVCDYKLGVEQIMNFLLQLGHTQIGLVHAEPAAQTMRDMIDVYETRMRASNVPVDDSWLADGRFTEEGGADAAKQLLEQHPEITAIFACNDKMALGVMHQLKQMGIEIPNQMSVVGFDDIQQMAYVSPSLTTIHLPLYEVGNRACERLVERIRGKRESVDDILPTHLVIRDSTAIAPS